MNIVKPWYKSKTLGFALLTVVVGIAAFFGFQEFEPDPELSGIITASITIAVAAINAILRYITKQPIA